MRIRTLLFIYSITFIAFLLKQILFVGYCISLLSSFDLNQVVRSRLVFLG